MPTEQNPLKSVVLGLLETFLHQTLAPNATPTEIRQAVSARPELLAIDAALVASCQEEIIAARYPSARPPRLLVDWGELPRAGQQTRPLFTLICEGYEGQPTVRALVDSELDHDPDDPLRRLRGLAEGLWAFYLPFRLTHRGGPCLPGQYLLRFEVVIPGTGILPPRFFHATIRITIPGLADESRVLEIEGDGQSVVNLHGHDLATFGKVILKGGDRGIINLQLPGGMPNPGILPAVKATTFEYTLQPDRERESRLPRVISSGNCSTQDAVTLVKTDGKRIHLLARKRLTLGRQRDNDVMIRFLPRSEANDAKTLNLSRTHLTLELVEAGLLLCTDSSKGVEVDGREIKPERLLTVTNVGEDMAIDLAATLTGTGKFGMSLRLFGTAITADRSEQLEWDTQIHELMDERSDRLWDLASTSGIDACRLRRVNNRPESEEYVALYREATVGPDERRHAVAWLGADCKSRVRIINAARSFWLHIDGRDSLTANSVPLTGPVLYPLTPGQEITMGGETIIVHEYQQVVG